MDSRKGRLALLLISALSSIAVLISGVSFAWINWNVGLNINSGITLTAAKTSIDIDMYAYAGQNLSSSSAASAYYVNSNGHNGSLNMNVTSSTTDGTLYVTLSDSLLSGISLSDFYLNENTLTDDYLPQYVIEFRYVNSSFDSYLRGTIDYASAYSPSGADTLLNGYDIFSYRIVTTANDSANLYESGMVSSFDDLKNKDMSSFFATPSTPSVSSLDLFTPADETGGAYDSSKTVSEQCYIPGFSGKNTAGDFLYSKVSLLEVCVNPLTLLNYYKDNESSCNSSLGFGISFAVNFSFSDSPFYES